jgi:dipeptidyl aminopeptidase/acylaminoacyl peptidase
VAAEAAPPPASAFGRIPAVVDAAISPNGQHVAILGGAADRRMISIATIDQPNLPRLDLGDVETVDVRWAGNDHVLATIAFWQKEGPKAAYRVERHITVNTQAQAVARFLDTGTNGAWYSVGQPLLQVTAEAAPRAVVVDLAGVGGGGQLGIWLVDPATGKGKLLERGDDDTYAFDVDRSGEPRLRMDSDRMVFWGRPKGKSQWTAVLPSEDDRKATRVLGYTEPDDGVYLQRDDKIVIRKLSDGSTAPFADGGETTGLVWDSRRNTAVATVTAVERPTFNWLDKEVGAAHGVLARAFKGQHVDLAGWSDDRTRFVARVTSPANAPVWYLYDKGRKEVSLLAEEYPELKGVAFGATRWITYKAGDGLEIPAYVTIPPGAASGSKLPLIVMPHGGPSVRDGFDFDYTAQFLATRGYVVLQPQFRGSGGFGDKFKEAGHGEWAGKMQTDLLDGVKALAEAGDIDPNRVCIVGASFGGYAALAGAAFHPDAYRCAVSFAGIADLGQLLVEDGRVYGRDSEAMDGLKKQLGGATRAALEAGSPSRHARDVRAPILLVHGDQDTIVRVEQSRRMADALKAANKPYELVVLEGENHYLTKSANRTRMLEALEAFLAKNLPVN